MLICAPRHPLAGAGEGPLDALGGETFVDFPAGWGSRTIIDRRWRELPFEQSGRFWRGNLHTHSNQSDGEWPPDQVARLYQEAGYDFVAITDHFRPKYGFPLTDTPALRNGEFTTLLGAGLHAPRTEFSTEWHILAVGLPLGFPPPGPGETGPELARRAHAAGAFIGLAHPAASLLILAPSVPSGSRCHRRQAQHPPSPGPQLPHPAPKPQRPLSLRPPIDTKRLSGHLAEPDISDSYLAG